MSEQQGDLLPEEDEAARMLGLVVTLPGVTSVSCTRGDGMWRTEIVIGKTLYRRISKTPAMGFKTIFNTLIQEWAEAALKIGKES